jgi:hypothetical protein
MRIIARESLRKVSRNSTRAIFKQKWSDCLKTAVHLDSQNLSYENRRKRKFTERVRKFNESGIQAKVVGLLEDSCAPGFPKSTL